MPPCSGRRRRTPCCHWSSRCSRATRGVGGRGAGGPTGLADYHRFLTPRRSLNASVRRRGRSAVVAALQSQGLRWAAVEHRAFDPLVSGPSPRCSPPSHTDRPLPAHVRPDRIRQPGRAPGAVSVAPQIEGILGLGHAEPAAADHESPRRRCVGAEAGKPAGEPAGAMAGRQRWQPATPLSGQCAPRRSERRVHLRRAGRRRS